MRRRLGAPAAPVLKGPRPGKIRKAAPLPGPARGRHPRGSASKRPAPPPRLPSPEPAGSGPSFAEIRRFSSWSLVFQIKGFPEIVKKRARPPSGSGPFCQNLSCPRRSERELDAQARRPGAKAGLPQAVGGVRIARVDDHLLVGAGERPVQDLVVGGIDPVRFGEVIVLWIVLVLVTLLIWRLTEPRYLLPSFNGVV